MHKPWSRRDFLIFMGVTSSVASFGCDVRSRKHKISGIPASAADDLLFAEDFESKLLISWGDSINSRGDRFGFNNDFIAFVHQSANEAILWVNHEYPDALFVHGKAKAASLEDVVEEQKSVGGSLLKIKFNASKSEWSWVFDDPFNRRLDANTRIPIISSRPIAGAKEALGTMANCGGGVTPWGNILTCEENYQDYYGEREVETEALPTQSSRGWASFIQRPPEHYGWVVEVNPLTGESKKLTSLGRFSHESATVTTARDGRCIVYSGDDAEDECLYKFISSEVGSLDSGTLYVANFESKTWVPLEISQSSILQQHFKDQLDVLIHTRRAAKLVGGTPLHRPEDVEIHPHTGDVFVALTNHFPKGDRFGSLLRIREAGGDPLAFRFEFDTFLMGGLDHGFACPDNLAFDKEGNLWMTTDMGVSHMNKGVYSGFGNNSLFFIPTSGPFAGEVVRVASGPVGAELTGPCFSADGKFLFLSVQHPGEKSPLLKELTSHWPNGGNEVPRPSVVSVKLPVDQLKKMIGAA